MKMGRTLIVGGWALLMGVMAWGGMAPTYAWAKEGPQGFNDGSKVGTEPPSEAELMYEAMKRSGRSKNDAAIDRAIARAKTDSEKNRKALRMELAARAWRDPFVDDGDRVALAESQRSAGSSGEELETARAEAARARKETARARAEAAAARREAARAKTEAARTEAVAQADAALARAEAARANADAARAEAKAARSDALAARASCSALSGPRVHRPTTTLASAQSSTASPKRIPTMGRARLASATVSRATQPAEAPPPVVDDVPKLPPPSAPAASTGNPGGFIVVPIPPAPPAQGRTGGRRP